MSFALISASVLFTTFICSSKFGCDISTTCTSKSASRNSSRVDLKLSTKPCGSFRINPTVSVKRNGRFSITTFLTVVSKVAKSLFSANTSLFESRFIRVDFPTLVYPTKATRTKDSLFFLCTVFCLSISFNFSFKSEIFDKMILLSVSICVSPTPLIVNPAPPLCLSRCVHILVRRGKRY